MMKNWFWKIWIKLKYGNELKYYQHLMRKYWDDDLIREELRKPNVLFREFRK